MIRFLKWILKHPVSVLISILILIIVGIISLIHIPVEAKPKQTEQGIQIIAHWGRHSPENIQKILTQPIEDVVMQLKDIISVESSSGVGTAIIKLYFSKNTDMKYIYIELRERLAGIRDEIPTDVNLTVDPIYKGGEEGETFTSSFFEIELIGPLPMNELHIIANERVLPKLNAVDGIARLDVYGGSRGFVQIQLNKQKISEFGINIDEIYRKLDDWTVHIGLGHVSQLGSEYLLSIDSRPERIQDFDRIPIGNGVALGDISKISFSYEEPEKISRHNFNPLILIRVFKTQGVNALSFSHSITGRLDEIKTGLPENVSLRVAFDGSTELRDELKSLAVRSIFILGVVFIILFMLFGRWLHSFIVTSVIILSFLGSAIFLFSAGYTINIITLAGIALVFGMLVDNTIVVVENIQRIRTLGKSPAVSGMHGTLEIFQPLIASTITTVFVFITLFFLEDRLGAYYNSLAYVLGISLIVSLFIAVVLIPALFIRWPDLMRIKKSTVRRKIWTERYGNFISFLISWRKTSICLVFLLFVLASALFWKNTEKGGFFTWKENKNLSILVDAPKGVTMKVLEDIIYGFERVIQEFEIPSETQTIIDESESYGYIKISFPDSIINTLKPIVLKEYLISAAVNYAGVGIGIYGFGMPYWNGGYQVRTMYNTVLRITGPDYYHLWEVGENILKVAGRDPRVSTGVISPSTRSLYQSEIKEIILEADHKLIWQNKLSLTSVINGIGHLLMYQDWRGDAVIEEKRYPVKLRYGESLPGLESLKSGYINIGGKRNIPVSEYFNIKKKPVQPWIDKVNQQYRFTVAWQYQGPERMRSRHESDVLQTIQLPPGYKIENSWQGFLTEEEKSDLLKLLCIVVIGSFIILASFFESFLKPVVIFFTVPFSLIGVFLFYIIFEREFNINSYIGLIILLGIVLNNGIVLVERINQLLRTTGLSITDAAIQGSIERIRPIMITTLTTIGGLIPLIFLPSGSSTMAKILEELSFITIGGLAGSTLLTITMIPVVYVIMGNIKFSGIKINFRK